MKKTLHNIAKGVLTVVALASFLCLFAEASTAAGQFLLTLGSLSVFALCVRGLDSLGTFNSK